MDGVEIGVAAFRIRLGVVAFGPLVPCFQENGLMVVARLAVCVTLRSVNAYCR